MSNAAKDSIKFRLRYKKSWGTSVYIVLNCAETLGYPYQMECMEFSEENNIWETPFIYFNQQIDEQIISYFYFTARTEDDEVDRQQVYWRNTQNRMDRQIRRSICRNKCIVKFDQCHVRDDSLGIEQKEMMKIVRLNLTLIKNVEIGRWIYAMPMPDRLTGDFNEAQLLKAERMSRYRTRNPQKSVWKIMWTYTEEQLERLGGSHNIAFFQSYYYKRMMQHWHAVLPDGTRRTMEQVAAMLEQNQIAYQMEMVDGKTGQKLQSFRNGLEEQQLVKKKIIYEATEDVDFWRIYAVYAISEYFGRQKMNKVNGKQGKLWQTEILVNQADIDYIQALFQVNLIDEVTNAVVVATTSRYSLKSQPATSANDYSTYFYGKGNLSNYTVYHRNGNNMNANNNGRYNGTVNNVYGRLRRTMSQGGSSRAGGNYFGLCNPGNQNYNYYQTTFGIFSGRPPTVNSNTSNNRNSTATTFSRSIPFDNSTYFSSYSRSEPVKQIRQYVDVSCKQSQSVKSGKSTSTSWSNYYSRLGSMQTGNQSNGNGISSVGSSSISNSSTISSVSNMQSHIPYYSSSSSSSNKSTSSLSTCPSTSSLIQTYTNYNPSSFSTQSSSYITSINNVTQLDKTILQSVRVTDILQPKVLLKLVRRTEIEEVVDKFEKEKQKLVEKYDQISDCFVEAKELRKMQEELSHQLQQNNAELQLMTFAKRWCKNSYSDQQQSKIFQTIKKYHPELQTQPNPQYIHSLLLHLNQQIITVKNYQKQTLFGKCPSCWQNVQYAKLIQIQVSNTPPRMYTLEQIKKVPLFDNIYEAICGSFEDIIKFALSKGVIVKRDKSSETNKSSEATMRLVMYFAVFYCLGRKYLDKNAIGRFSALCGDFTPFANQTNESFLLAQLQSILPKFQAYTKNRPKNKKQETQFKLKQTQQKIMQKVQQITGKKLVQMISIDFQIQKIKQQMEQTNNNILTINVLIDLQNSEKQFIEELEHIDGMLGDENRQEERFAKIRSLSGHKYLKTMEKLS